MTVPGDLPAVPGVDRDVAQRSPSPCIAERSRTPSEQPFFSICIPQYNRTDFLIEVLRSLDAQTFRDFEVCISDDCSTDGRQQEVVDFLEHSNLTYAYHRQTTNLRYDGNLRQAIMMARGRYCFLLGNDDKLAHEGILAELHLEMLRWEGVGVVVTNFRDVSSGRLFRRVQATGIVGRGPPVASQNYRDVSFVSGVLLDRQLAQQFATAAWDGTEMYQMYLSSRIIASGSRLLHIDKVAVRMGLLIEGQEVDSYANRRDDTERRLEERLLPLRGIGRLVADAIRPFVTHKEWELLTTRIIVQLLLFTYPFWVFEYRRIRSWWYAVGICLGMRPRHVVGDLELSLRSRLLVSAAYALVTAVCLVVPVRAFQVMYPLLYRVAKLRRGFGAT